MENTEKLCRDCVYIYIGQKYIRDVFFPDMEISLSYKSAFYKSLKFLGLKRVDAKYLEKCVAMWHRPRKDVISRGYVSPHDFMPREEFDEYLNYAIMAANDRKVISVM